MKLPRRNFLHLAACAAALPTASRFAWAQAYPTRPVRIIIGFAPGGVVEIVARLIGQSLSERLGRGLATSFTDLLGGQVQVAFASTISSIEYVKTGRLRALAVTA